MKTDKHHFDVYCSNLDCDLRVTVASENPCPPLLALPCVDDVD